MGYKIHPVTGRKYEYETKFDFDIKEIYWAAGFFEGEGCISITRANNPNHRPTIEFSVGQKEIIPLRRFIKALGFGKIWGPKLNKTCEMYQVKFSSFEEVQAAIVILWIALKASPKREQYKEKLVMYLALSNQENSNRKRIRQWGLRRVK